MASNYPKYLLSSVMAAKGDSTIPPATASEAGEGRLSQGLKLRLRLNREASRRAGKTSTA